MKNLFVSYDLMKQGQDYAKIETGIKSIGRAYKVHFSLWYVVSNLSAVQAYNALRPYVDSNDKLLVIEAANAAAGEQTPALSTLQQNWG